MAKRMDYSTAARAKLLKGINKLADSVRATLGPNGRYVILEKNYGTPLITNDGVTVAKEIDLEDPVENMGAKLLQEVSSKTNDAVGDGTTTAIVLTQAIVTEGLKQVEAGVNPILVREGIQTAANFVANELDKMSIKVDSDDKIKAIAEISSKDKEVGALIQGAIKKVGTNGMVTIEESNSYETHVDVVEGMHFDQGFASPHMAEPNKSSTSLSRPYVLVTDRKINSIQDLVPLLELVVKSGKELLIVAADYDEEVIAALVINRIRGAIKNVIAVKAPFGGDRSAFLEDVAIYTGATFITENGELHLKDITFDELGQVARTEVSKDRTVLINGRGDKRQIEQRVSELKDKLENEDSKYEKDAIQKRLAKLSAGVGVIKVGAATEVELKEKKLRIEDALNSTYAALEAGVVPGGGLAFLKASANLKPASKLSPGVKVGFEILRESLKVPLKRIAENSGFNGDVVLNKVEESKLELGFDAIKGTHVDVVKAGIIDPAKTAKNAVLNAASVAGLVLTTEVAVTSTKEDNDSPVM